MRKTPSLFTKKLPYEIPTGFSFKEYGSGFYMVPVEDPHRFQNSDEGLHLSVNFRKVLVALSKRIIAAQMKKSESHSLEIAPYYEGVSSAFPFIEKNVYLTAVNELVNEKMVVRTDEKIHLANEEILTAYAEDFNFLLTLAKGDFAFIRIKEVTPEIRTLFGIRDIEATRIVEEFMLVLELFYSKSYLDSDSSQSFENLMSKVLDKIYTNYLSILTRAIEAEMYGEPSFFKIVEYIGSMEIDINIDNGRNLIELYNTQSKKMKEEVVYRILKVYREANTHMVMASYPEDVNVGWLVHELNVKNGILVDSIQLSKHTLVMLNSKVDGPNNAEIVTKVKEWMLMLKEGKLNIDTSFVEYSKIPLTSKLANMLAELSDKLVKAYGLSSDYHITCVYDSLPDVKLSNKATEYYMYA